MDFVDIVPLVFTIVATLIYKLIGKPEKETDKETLSKTLEIIDDRLELHQDLVNIYTELQEIHKLMKASADGC